jgi:hypothetical protein
MALKAALTVDSALYILTYMGRSETWTKELGCRKSYTCTCTYVHMHMGTYAHGYICTWVHMHMGTYAHVYICTCVHMHMCTYAHVYICTWVHMHMCTSAHVYICTYVATCGLICSRRFQSSSSHHVDQGCQMVSFRTQNPNFGYILEDLGMKYVVIPMYLYSGHLEYFTTIGYILCEFGNFVVIWKIFPIFGCTKKNLATLRLTEF